MTDNEYRIDELTEEWNELVIAQNELLDDTELLATEKVVQFKAFQRRIDQIKLLIAELKGGSNDQLFR